MTHADGGGKRPKAEDRRRGGKGEGEMAKWGNGEMAKWGNEGSGGLTLGGVRSEWRDTGPQRAQRTRRRIVDGLKAEGSVGAKGGMVGADSLAPISRWESRIAGSSPNRFESY